MALNKISSEVVEINVDNYIESAFKAGNSLSDLGWSTYADSAGVNPVDGLGGSPNITASLNTSSPLSGDADLRIVKDAANRQGQGIGYNFTIENRHLAKVLQISFDAELISGNYESPIITPTTGTYSISSTTCTVTAPHSFVQGQVVNMTFTSGTVPPNGTYVITSVTATTFVFTVASGSGTGNCSYTVPADLRISIIQDPTGSPVVLEPVNTGIQLGIANQRIRHIASFQTHISITSYRLCVHVANASTVAYTVDFANFKVWEPTQSIGTVITDWQSYTPTFTNMGTVSSINTQWRRVGGSLEVRGNFTTGSVSVSGGMNFTLPGGLIPNVGWTSGNGTVVGLLQMNDSNQANHVSLLARNDNIIRLGNYISSSGSIPLVYRTDANLVGSNTLVNFSLSVPIAGWGSSVAMSSDTGDSRVVAAKYKNQPSQTSSATVPLQFTTVEYDTHNAVTVGTVNTSNAWKYTAPISGYYRVTVSSYCNTTTSVYNLYKNGTSVGRIADFITTSVTSASTTILLNSGDFIDIRCNQSFPAFTDAYITVERISAGSQVIASVEGVNLLYTTASNTHNSTGNFIDLIFGTKVKDSHGAYNTTTGIFTAPMNGVYSIYSQAVFALNATGARQLAITDLLNNFISYGSAFNSTSSVSNLGYSNIKLENYPMVAGQQIKIRYWQTSGGNLSLRTELEYNRLSITRTGNY